MLQDGLYAFDADQQQVGVLKGEAQGEGLVQDNDQQVKVNGDRKLHLNRLAG
jgi:hypothetical protein